MEQNNIALVVKNMVCNRCIKVIREELMKYNIDFVRIDFGTIYFDHIITEKEKETLIRILKKEGFELVEGREARIVNKIKGLVIKKIHHGKEKSKYKIFSNFISSNIGMEYSQISKLFSISENRSIKNYFIAQKIERAKELLKYDELTISQISFELDYSSPQHLSRQFKQVTGLTPTVFKKIGERKKLDTV